MRKILILVLLIMPLLDACQNMDGFLFNPKVAEEYVLPGNNIPDSLITPVELTSDGNKLYGFWVKSPFESHVNMLYFHGNKYGIDNYWDRVMIYNDMGINVFIFDYRGFGMSEGESTESGLQEDAKVALDYILDLTSPNDTLIFYGYSLGCYPAIYTAAYLKTPDRLFAESPFASANSITQSSMGIDIPQRWITEGAFDNATNIQEVNTYFMLFHSKDDDYLGWEANGRIIYENANEPKQLILAHGALHETVPQTIGIEFYKQTMWNWIRNPELKD